MAKQKVGKFRDDDRPVPYSGRKRNKKASRKRDPREPPEGFEVAMSRKYVRSRG